MTSLPPAPGTIVVIGGGQAGLAVGYFLRRANLPFVILDRQAEPGGAWRHGWDSLRLFSPAEWSSLPGWPMPPHPDGYPRRDDVMDYLARYEQRYSLPVVRPVTVNGVTAEAGGLRVVSDHGDWLAPAVVMTTGTWGHPKIPDYPGRAEFAGQQIHSAQYRSPAPFAGQRVMIIGGGNSGAQILAEVSELADTLWITASPPQFLPDEVDGRVLFERATARWKAQQEGRPLETLPGGFGDVVMVAPVRAARARGVLRAEPPFARFTQGGVIWADGRTAAVDAVIWCTGFAPDLGCLAPLGILTPEGRVAVTGTRSVEEPRLWCVGYGDWTGMASATLIGVMRSARATAAEIAAALA